MVYKTNFFRQVWENPSVNTFFLYVALTCIGFLVSVLLYITFIGPCMLRRSIELEVDLPALIPIMSIAGVAVFICSILAMWPVWGFLTPIYMLIVFFGATFSMMFLPSGNLGNLLFWVGTGAIGYVSHTLPHDAIW